MTKPSRILASRVDIAMRVRGLAAAIKDSDYQPDIVIPILTGSLMFAADLMRDLYTEGLNPTIGFLKMQRAASPVDPNKTVVLTQAKLTTLVPGGVQGKRVLLLDGIFDTGKTIHYAKMVLADLNYTERNAADVKVCTLVWRQLPDVTERPDWYGIGMSGRPNYIWGYGMDSDHRYRGCPDIWEFVE